MTETMLKELRKRFNMLQCLMINNSATGNNAINKFNQILFTARVLKVSLSKNETAYSQAQIRQVSCFIDELNDFKAEYADLFVEEEIDDSMIEDFKTHLPERIKTNYSDSLNIEL